MVLIKTTLDLKSFQAWLVKIMKNRKFRYISNFLIRWPDDTWILNNH